MARTPSLSSMSVEALLKLRDDVGKVLSQKAVQLEEQLSKLGGEVGSGRRARRSGMKGRKVPIKYRDKEGNTWAGRGAQPAPQVSFCGDLGPPWLLSSFAAEERQHPHKPTS
jgi:hypothetical protein